MQARVDAMERRLRDHFEVKSGYKDAATQARLLQRHFRTFDVDASGTVDFDEFSKAMIQLNFVGVQAEIEALFDRFDEDLNGVISYSEFARGILGAGGALPHFCNPRSGKSRPMLERVRDLILEAGGKNGLRTLGVILRRMDQNGDKVVEFSEFESGLRELGLVVGADVDRDELQRVFEIFDRDRSGRITLDELMRGLRGAMPKRRIKIVKEAFQRLDKSGDGRVSFDEIEKIYDPSHHPEVLAGHLQPRDALLEFMRVFEDASTSDGVITWHEFLSYYKDLSAGMDDDDAFELMMRNTWHISGGRGWCANSANRRVLVTFHNGSQRVVEIENDLGVGPKDKRRIIQKLAEEQGIRGIADVSFAH